MGPVKGTSDVLEGSGFLRISDDWGKRGTVERKLKMGECMHARLTKKIGEDQYSVKTVKLEINIYQDNNSICSDFFLYNLSKFERFFGW